MHMVQLLVKSRLSSRCIWFRCKALQGYSSDSDDSKIDKKECRHEPQPPPFFGICCLTRCIDVSGLPSVNCVYIWDKSSPTQQQTGKYFIIFFILLFACLLLRGSVAVIWARRQANPEKTSSVWFVPAIKGSSNRDHGDSGRMMRKDSNKLLVMLRFILH